MAGAAAPPPGLFSPISSSDGIGIRAVGPDDAATTVDFGIDWLVFFASSSAVL